MITKFERKVIAGLTAFLMCLSMIFAVPVSVNAEAERTQDEAVSGVQQNETVKDVQIPDGMSENVPHDIIAGDEAGDVPHDITVGDEASEKVQQDTVEAGGAAKEKEDQPTAPYEEETRTPQMLNVDQQEEVAGTITLKKDGTPEYGEVAFSTEQTMVRYRLNIEEDGQYYFGLIKDWNVSAYVSLFERTDEGDNYLSNESYSYELRKDGNYYLEIEKSSEEALETLKWYAGKVRDIKPGEFEAELLGNQRIIAGNVQFKGIAAGRGVGFTTGLLLLRKGLGMQETPIRPHSWHCRMQSDYQYDGNRKRPPVWRRHRGSLRPRGRNLGRVEGMTGSCGSGCDPAIHARRLRVYHRPRRLRMASRISIFFAARRFEPLNSMG